MWLRGRQKRRNVATRSTAWTAGPLWGAGACRTPPARERRALSPPQASLPSLDIGVVGIGQPCRILVRGEFWPNPCFLRKRSTHATAQYICMRAKASGSSGWQAFEKQVVKASQRRFLRRNEAHRRRAHATLDKKPRPLAGPVHRYPPSGRRPCALRCMAQGTPLLTEFGL